MKPPLSMILIGCDAQERSLLRQQLAGTGRIQIVAETGEPARAIELVKELEPQSALVMMNGQPEETLRLIGDIAAARSELQLICTGIQTPSDQVVRAFRAGAFEFLSQPLNMAETTEVLERIDAIRADQGAKSVQQGSVIACYSARGGSGCTTVAVNLAISLARQTRHEVALIDLNLQTGAAPVFFGVEPTYTIADVSRNQERLDLQLLRSFLTPCKEQVYLLAAPMSVEEADDVHPAHVERLLPLICGHFPYVVVDCPHTLDVCAVPVFDAANAILNITLMDMPGIYGAKRMLRVYKEMGYQDQKLKLIVNRYAKSSALTLEKVRQAIGHPITATLADEPRAVTEAMNLGSPFTISQPKSPLLKDYVTLTQLLAAGDPAEQKAQVRKRFSLFGTRK